MAKALVVGGGFGGIASALRLRAKGYSVSLVDRCERLGGRAQVFVKDGFRHDAGPTVITAPFLFEELFHLFGRRLEDYAELRPLTPWYRFVFPDGTHFNYGGSLEDTLAEIAQFNPGDTAGYLRLLNRSRKIFDIGFTQLADTPFHRLSTMFKQVPDLVRLGSHRTVWDLVRSNIRDDRLRQAFSIQPLLVGGNPFDTTSIYSLIHYLERRWGIHFVMGGTGALVNALSRLMAEVGIEVKLESTVDQIDVNCGRATGVVLNEGTKLDADIVVSDVDPMHLYTHMIPSNQQSLSARVKCSTSKMSMGLYVLFFGTNRTYPSVAHHTIWLGQRYKSLLDDIFHNKHLAEDFSLYIHRPTATDKSFAPPGNDSFYVLAPVPNLQAGIDWETEGKKLRDRIVTALSKSILPGLDEHIVSDFWMTPKDFETRYLSSAGAGFSIAPLFRQSAWFRFHNRGEGIENLYLVGAGTHPGAGLPGVLCSAKVLDRLVPAATSEHLIQAYSQSALAA